MTISVVIADDEALIRTGLRAIIEAEPDLAVAGEAADGAEVVPLVRRLQPDLVLMDVRMPAVDGIQATRHLVETSPDPPKVLVVTTFENDDHVYDALRVGASGFLVKSTEPADLIRGVRAVASGDALLSPGVTRRLVAEFATRAREPRPSPELDQLTDREREVMGLVAAGLSNDEIAAKLVVSPATAKTHVSRAMVKLRARDRAQLVVFAYESGLVRPGWLP